MTDELMTTAAPAAPAAPFPTSLHISPRELRELEDVAQADPESPRLDEVWQRWNELQAEASHTFGPYSPQVRAVGESLQLIFGIIRVAKAAHAAGDVYQVEIRAGLTEEVHRP
jgi:hypothetical protein